MNGKAKASLSKQEQNAIKAAAFMVWGMVLINSIFALLFLNNKTAHIGFGWIIGGFALNVAALGIFAAFIVLFVKRLVHIKAQKDRYILTLVLMLIMAVGEIWLGADYNADLFGGAHEIVTEEYKIYDDTEFHFADGEKNTYVFIPNDIGAEIAEVPLVSDNYSEVVSENSLYIHTESVYIKYYPHSKVIVTVERVSSIGG